MIHVTEASVDDFKDVYTLLRQLNDTTIDEETWKKTFADVFNAGGTPGYLLKDGHKVVGFFGTIFSNRPVDGKEHRFCNCHSWIVDPEYRSHGLLLLNKIHKLKGHIITNFSASAGPYQIMKKLKWKEVDNSHSIFFIDPWLALRSTATKVLNGKDMWLALDSNERKIADDHRHFSCTLNAVETRYGHSLQVFKSLDYFPSKFAAIKPLVPWKFQLGQLYYTSNMGVFFSDFKNNLTAICKKEKWIGLVIPNRMLKHAGIPSGKRYHGNRPVLIRADVEFDAGQLDLLYSEMFILDLN